MSAATASPPVLELSMKEVEEILERLKASGLAVRDQGMLRALVDSYVFLVGEIADRRASIDRLRQMLFGAKTETGKNVKERAGKSGNDEKDRSKEKPKKKKKRKGHGRIPATAYTGADRVKVPHESLSRGDPCPCCRGKVYGKPPRLLVRIRGSAPFVATVYEQEYLRCGLCGEVFTAKLPEEVGEEKFDHTVASMAAFLRYGNGLPMNRIEGLQKVMGVPFPASIQWELMRDAARKMEAAYFEHIRQAAQGEVLHNDDTPMKILDFLVEKKKREERGEKPPERTGTYTSGIVSKLADDRLIALYFTGQKHAGENLARVLAERASGMDPPMQMCDALSSNAPGEMKTILGNCLAHARRQFVDVVAGFPREVEHVIDEISLVYRHDAQAKAEKMSAEQRLRFHQEQSGPIMDELKIWMETLLAEKQVEPNSGLGKAIAYCLKRWEHLTLFLHQAGAPLDNNICERILKKAIMHRKNSLFYKTDNGAAVGDLYMALIATAKLAKADPFDYLNQLQLHAPEVEANPSEWMPWNYRETMAGATATS